MGKISIDLGAGRKKKDEDVDRRVGIILCKKIGDKVEVGDCLAYIHANTSEELEEKVENLKSAYEIVRDTVKKENVIDEIL